ncbi:unnamed protein product [Ilex paraguariensis]|uniref:Polygalacturonase n=1 Tax=Ilex paraguariensis TaxID=185542 RepID=A0ABC8SS93_9AQUA
MGGMINGTSVSDVAIKFDCTERFPCEGILLQDINIVREASGAAKAMCSCSHVNVKETGAVSPHCS